MKNIYDIWFSNIDVSNSVKLRLIEYFKISGLSEKIIVVEAKEKSGSLITVDYALEQGKDIFAVPGNINSSNSKGTNKMILEGAKIFTNVEDIFFLEN